MHIDHDVKVICKFGSNFVTFANIFSLIQYQRKEEEEYFVKIQNGIYTWSINYKIINGGNN